MSSGYGSGGEVVRCGEVASRVGSDGWKGEQRLRLAVRG